MPAAGTSLLDILDPPLNTWLRELGKRKVPLPAGIRLVRHENGEEDAFERSERLRVARQKLHDFADL
jgi:hypothetical protein